MSVLKRVVIKVGSSTLVDADGGPDRAYLDSLERTSAAGLMVSCADKLHNARCIVAALRRSGPEVWDNFNGGRDGSLRTREMVLEMPNCTTIGDFLVLNNLLQDLTIAAN